MAISVFNFLAPLAPALSSQAAADAQTKPTEAAFAEEFAQALQAAETAAMPAAAPVVAGKRELGSVALATEMTAPLIMPVIPANVTVGVDTKLTPELLEKLQTALASLGTGGERGTEQKREDQALHELKEALDNLEASAEPVTLDAVIIALPAVAQAPEGQKLPVATRILQFLQSALAMENNPDQNAAPQVVQKKSDPLLEAVQASLFRTFASPEAIAPAAETATQNQVIASQEIIGAPAWIQKLGQVQAAPFPTNVVLPEIDLPGEVRAPETAQTISEIQLAPVTMKEPSPSKPGVISLEAMMQELAPQALTAEIPVPQKPVPLPTEETNMRWVDHLKQRQAPAPEPITPPFGKQALPQEAVALEGANVIELAPAITKAKAAAVKPQEEAMSRAETVKNLPPEILPESAEIAMTLAVPAVKTDAKPEQPEEIAAPVTSEENVLELAPTPQKKKQSVFDEALVKTPVVDAKLELKPLPENAATSTAPELTLASIEKAKQPQPVHIAQARAVSQHPVILSQSQVSEQVHVGIKRAAEQGIDSITIQLDPADLGRVDVRMNIDRDGKAMVVFAVDKVETLDMLQRDARGLERALQDAGVKADAGSMEFNLRQQPQQASTGGDSHQQRQPGLANEIVSESDKLSNITSAPATVTATQLTYNVTTGLNVVI